MPRPKSIVPQVRLHKASGQAVVYVNRREVYLGPYNSADALQAYALLLDRLKAGIDVTSTVAAKRQRPTAFPLSAVFLRFVTEELSRYSKAEQHCLKGTMKIARELFGETPAAEFGPLRLRAVRDVMIKKGWSRSFINKQVKRLRMVLRWAVGWELIPQTVVDSLSAVKSLGVGDSTAAESRPRRAVPDSELMAVRALLTPIHRDVFDLMLMTGCRPGELLGLTTADINRAGEIWRAELAHHKTAHKGKGRTLFFNATAQTILQRHLKADPAARLLPVARNSFGNAVVRACEVAFGMPAELRGPTNRLTSRQRAEAKAWRRKHAWTPHWLRHTVATRLADEVGTEAAQRLLGHASKAMTEHYSRAAEKQAIAAAKRLG